MNDVNSLVDTIMALGIIAQLFGIGIVVLHIVLVIWIFSDYEKRGGGGCGGCFWALFVLHFGLLGLLCYLVVRPSLREPIQAQQVIIQQPGAPPAAAPPPAATAPPPAATAPAPASTVLGPTAPRPALPLARGSTPRTVVESSAHCPGCRAAVSPSDRFCDNCGSRIDTPTAGPGESRTMIIGREATSDIFFDQPQVSARHGVLTITPHGTFIEDLGSTNGTTLRGKRVHGQMQIHPGDIIELGSFRVTYEQLVRMTRR